MAHETRSDIEDELEALAARVAEGDQAAIEDLALTLKQFIQPYVLKALRGLKAASDDAEDLAQDVWLECYRVAGQYDPARGRAAAYFGRVAFQAAHYKSRAIRHRQRWLPFDGPDPASPVEMPPPVASAPPGMWDDPETAVVVRESVEHILSLLRTTLPADVLADLVDGDAASRQDRRGLPPDRAHAVQLARRRARRLLRRHWADLPASFQR